MTTSNEAKLDRYEQASRDRATAEVKAAREQHAERVELARLMLGTYTEEGDNLLMLSHREAAQEVLKSPDAIRKYITAGELKATKIPGKRQWWITLADWQRFKRLKRWATKD